MFFSGLKYTSSLLLQCYVIVDSLVSLFSLFFFTIETNGTNQSCGEINQSCTKKIEVVWKRQRNKLRILRYLHENTAYFTQLFVVYSFTNAVKNLDAG